MKCLLLCLALSGLLFNGSARAADDLQTPTKQFIAAPNGRVMRVDLNGDGRLERVSLRQTQSPERGKVRRFGIRVNGQKLNGAWEDEWWMGGGGTLSLDFRPLVRNGRRYLFLGGPYGLEGKGYKIYAWRGGRIRMVRSQAMMISRVENEGTVAEGFGYNAWAYTSFPWRLNRQGVLQIVPSVNPLYDTSTGKRNVRVDHLFEAIRFHQAPRASSPLFLIPKGATLVFDGTNTHHWIRARYGRKTGWLPGKTIDESKSFHFARAG